MRFARRQRASAFALVLVVLVAAAACSSSSHPSSSTASSKAPYVKTGPYEVGYTTRHLPDGRRVVIWYPATGSTSGKQKESIDLTSLLSPALQAKVPASDRVKYVAEAYPDLAGDAAKGPFPIVLFSHGYAGFPEQSVTLTTHLASWGFVVAAPDHVERSLDGLLGTAGQGVAHSTDPAVLQATLTDVEGASTQPGVLHGLADAKRVAVTGHSAGAGAAYQLASSDSRIAGWISYSVGFGASDGPMPAAPNKPGMVMLGTTDGIIAPAESRQVYAAMHPPKYLVSITGAGHLVFSDICLIGKSQGGITGIAKALQLPIPAELLKLGSDGCTADHPAVDKAFPAINQLSVAFLRSLFGIDKTPKGLDTAAVAGLGATVNVQHQG